MRNTAGQKVRDIIREEFDSRMEMAVVTYILDCGFEKLKEFTEEDIKTVKGDAFMTDEFCQALVRAAVRICKECSRIDEFLPFIVNYLYVPKADMKEVTFYQDEMTKYKWEEFIDKLEIEYEDNADEIEMVVLNANVMEVRNKNGE